MLVYIYVDTLFMENFIMNYIILALTSKYLKRHISIKINILGAAIASLYSIFVFFPSMKMYYTYIFKFIISMTIVYITFKPKKVREYVKNLVSFYAINILFGGCILAFFYFLGNSGYYNNGVFYIYNFPVKIIFAGAAVSYMVFRIGSRILQSRRIENTYLTVVISFDDRNAKVTGLIDTGNFLNDPITKSPVIVVEFKALRNILPEDIAVVYENNMISDFEKLVEVLGSSKWISRFRLIPFSSLGTENGMIMGFKPDSIKIINKNENNVVRNVIVAVCANELSRDNDYQALLNPDILNDVG